MVTSGEAGIDSVLLNKKYAKKKIDLHLFFKK